MSAPADPVPVQDDLPEFDQEGESFGRTETIPWMLFSLYMGTR